MADVHPAGTPEATGGECIRPRENDQRLIGGEWGGRIGFSQKSPGSVHNKINETTRG